MENTEAGFLNSPASSVHTEGASPIDTSQIPRRPTRISHTKSRKGCQQCKKRKVKHCTLLITGRTSGERLATALTLHQESSQRAMGLLKDLNPQNADGLFIFSSLTIVIAMATPKRSQQDGIPAGEGDFEDWIYLIQGTAELRTAFEQECSESCLTGMFSFSRQRWALHNVFHPSYDQRDEVLCQLEERIRDSVPEGEKLNVLIERIGSLRSAACNIPNWESTDLFFWLYGGIDGFLPLVKARDQEAWAVLAHFCLMVKRAETQWWLKGWADCMMRKIHMQLDEEHKSWILRLSEEMGWIPPATQ
ncbi:hypothetical protein DER44DRAFT_889502 [Fusarium oxysporum]|nr:hypothetical protein DER44DRAFT_889502 [Fusarium oxysporum]